MKRSIVCLAILVMLAQSGSAQHSRHIIWFTDKGTNPFTLSNPSDYLSQRAIDRRQQYNIPLDSTDLPVTPRYIDSVLQAGNITLLNVSKWLNAITIHTTDQAALATISSFPFVKSAAPVALRTTTPAAPHKKYNSGIQEYHDIFLTAASRKKVFNLFSNYFDYGLSFNQVHIHNGEFLHNIGLRGEGMIIGMLDAGFFSYLTLKSFDSIRTNGQILDTWDFVAGEASVNEDHPHGMQCLSVIAANLPGEFVGTAPRASFYLYRSEDAASEYPIEEHNWVCAAERVDSAGGDVISSSLGYYFFDDPSFSYTFSQMDGNTTISARGADLAAKKGILVVNSAGNEGNNSWGRIITPADGDSVLAVGAVTVAGIPASFTSRGPSADGQIKPDVASVGVQTVVQLSSNNIGTSNGTSFSCPNMAGLATCLWQGFREFSSHRILRSLHQAASHFTNPNDTIGYGIPDMKKAVMILLREFASASATVNGCAATISWTSKDVAGMRYDIERRFTGQSVFVKVGEVFGTGNVFGQPRNHSFTDIMGNAPSGTAIYRIRQHIDTSSAGAFADYIDTVSVSISVACTDGTAKTLRLTPNPSTGNLTLEVNTPEAISSLVIRLFNSKGQLISETRQSKNAGLVFISVPVYHLASGKYYVVVYDGDRKLGTEELIRLP